MEQRLTPKDVKDICAATLADLPLDGKRVLVLHPGSHATTPAPSTCSFMCLSDLLQSRVSVLDYMVATGTTRRHGGRIGSTVTSD